MNKGISIIIVSYNVATSLQKCIRSYSDQINLQTDEIFVIDNNSTDQSMYNIEKIFPNIKLIKNYQNVGYSKACNQGYKVSKNNIVIFSNGDIIVPMDFLENVREKMSSLTRCGIMSPQLKTIEGKIIQPSWSHDFTFFSQCFLSFFSPARVSRYGFIRKIVINKQKKEKIVPIVDGACMILNREMLDRIDGMDENFELYFEDVDICYRCRQAGFKVYFVPTIIAYHELGKSGKATPRKIKLIYRQSQIYYYRKHNSSFELIALKLYIFFKFVLKREWRDKVFFQYFLDILLEKRHLKLSDDIPVDE